ncbi:ADP/ATP-dependent (S)-NAD(P)H-hydrate dehydratase [Herbiconiux sp. L3-i23]|uniref:ADP-dependent NAD(P)H-hydrate dehydratase n=1 Tax=Herbiconiux sp. L3-i23 TaxID=2905871 RepID=UPI002058EC06|nr:ADP/ATP-dependent (S)-NAD(P)H-hydrate dehydratase [Herbiconiux sp. L3-i23]BDI23308.1 hypothetical protein L3i23_20840 [Herbiconiux sp. L3-i23]
MTDGWRDWSLEETAIWIRVPVAGDDKYSRGVVGVLTGSAEYPGAAVLGVDAAARAGSGMVRYLGDPEAARLVLQRRPEIVTAPGRVQSWLIGSGMDAAKRTGELAGRIREALAQKLPTVLDAGALDLAGEARGPVLLTPHAGELVTLLRGLGVETDRAAVEAEPELWARRAAELTGATVLLKGAVTHVVAPDRDGIRVRAGSPWLATAGSGDVLGGVLGALLAAQSERIVEDPSLLAEIAAAGASLHGRAGDRASAGGPIVALDIAEALPATIASSL